MGAELAIWNEEYSWRKKGAICSVTGGDLEEDEAEDEDRKEDEKDEGGEEDIDFWINTFIFTSILHILVNPFILSFRTRGLEYINGRITFH